MAKMHNEDYKELQKMYNQLKLNYKKDINKKIELERKLKNKNAQVKRLEHINKELQRDMQECMNIITTQTDIALAQLNKVNKIITLVNNLYQNDLISKEYAQTILEQLTNE